MRMAAVLVWGLLAAGQGRAEEAGEVPRLRLEAATSFPLDVGARLTLEGPARLQVATSLGLTPRPYFEALNGALQQAGVYDAQTGALLAAAFGNALSWRTFLGWRPAGGLYLLGGYGLLALGGGLTGSEALAWLLGQPLPEERGSGQVRARATAHQVHAELGYKWSVGPLSLGLGLGGFSTLAAHATLTPQTGSVAGDVALGLLTPLGERALRERIERSLHAPYLTATVGAAFL